MLKSVTYVHASSVFVLNGKPWEVGFETIVEGWEGWMEFDKKDHFLVTITKLLDIVDFQGFNESDNDGRETVAKLKEIKRRHGNIYVDMNWYPE